MWELAADVNTTCPCWCPQMPPAWPPRSSGYFHSPHPPLLIRVTSWNFPKGHPQSTLPHLRILAACSRALQSDGEQRGASAHHCFVPRWLREAASRLPWPASPRTDCLSCTRQCSKSKSHHGAERVTLQGWWRHGETDGCEQGCCGHVPASRHAQCKRKPGKVPQTSR